MNAFFFFNKNTPSLHPLPNLPVCHEMESSFPNFFETFYLLFWDLFGYGEIQTTAIFLPNLRFPKNFSEAEDHFLDPEDMLRFRSLGSGPKGDKVL